MPKKVFSANQFKAIENMKQYATFKHGKKFWLKGEKKGDYIEGGQLAELKSFKWKK